MLPRLGRLVARDADSYRYLAESIRKHPDQETLLGMMRDAGLEDCRYYNLTGGIVAVHRGYPALTCCRSSLNRALGSAVARAVADSSRARELVRRLEGRSLRIAITGSPWQLLLVAPMRTLSVAARVRPVDALRRRRQHPRQRGRAAGRAG